MEIATADEGLEGRLEDQCFMGGLIIRVSNHELFYLALSCLPPFGLSYMISEEACFVFVRDKLSVGNYGNY